MHHDDRPDDQLFIDYCDADAKWGPLLFLRPQRHVRLGLARTLTMSALLGCLFGVLGNIFFLLIAHALHRPTASPYAFPAVLTVAYFLIGNLTLAPAWNRRAARLSRRSDG